MTPASAAVSPIREGRRELTAAQRAVLDAIREHLNVHGLAPSLRELALSCGLKSTNGVSEHLERLERKGYIRREPCETSTVSGSEARTCMKARAITLVESTGTSREETRRELTRVRAQLRQALDALRLFDPARSREIEDG